MMVVMHPRERVWDALCERTCDLAPFLDHIESAELLSRETPATNAVRIVHLWRARANVPALLAPHVDKNLLLWTARTEWQPGQYESRWSVSPSSQGDEPLCEGRMRFAPAVGGKGTRVELELELLALSQTVAMRTMARTILTTHFRKLAEAAGRMLDAEQTGPTPAGAASEAAAPVRR